MTGSFDVIRNELAEAGALLFSKEGRQKKETLFEMFLGNTLDFSPI